MALDRAIQVRTVIACDAMPAKSARRSRTIAKARHVGSSRREAKATSRPSKSASRKVARGLGHDSHTTRLGPIHAKKDTADARAEATGKVRVGTPNVPGYTNNVDERKYAAMKDILLKVVPRKSPGLTQGEMFDAVRAAAGQNRFPGSTHRWWAKCVQLDLEAKGVLVRERTTPLRWHLK